MQLEDIELEYKATPTAARFHASDAKIRLLFGPVGCGKTVAACAEAMRLAMLQEPSPDGIRRTRGVFIRNTYPELKSTTIQTWTECFPPEIFGRVKWDSPINQRIRFNDVDLHIYFISLDSEQDIRKLLSLEITWAFVNEARFLSKALFDGIDQRLGRYPKDVKPTRIGMIMDTNPPDDDHWIYRLFEEEKPDGFEIFKYPPAMIRDKQGKFIMNPWAENINNLKMGSKYYTGMIPGKDPEWIKVYIEGKYGTVIDGKPVFSEYNDALHCAPETIRALPGIEIGLGWDFGLTPTLVITQLSARGQLRILAELTSQDMGLTQFVDNIALPYLNHFYPHWKTNYISFGDPAGGAKAQTDEKTCLSILLNAGIITQPAPTNAFIPRREAVAHFLTRLVDGDPAFLLSPTCKALHKGFLGAYHYERVRSTNDMYKDEPVKNASSHPMDALQYICMYYKALGNYAKATTFETATRIS